MCAAREPVLLLPLDHSCPLGALSPSNTHDTDVIPRRDTLAHPRHLNFSLLTFNASWYRRDR
jgi:hypothetical protein